MTEERLQEIRAMVNTGFIPAPGNATVAQLLEYSDSLDVENIRLRKALTDALKLMDKKFYGMAHKNIVEALGQEGEGNQ
ncbi:hypothetical protein [Paenibacillus sp. PAMC 26794]|uniref:hypothetical protein n=1 Tax=Paenibacillus sp. PAMC 26794 TaxID=1257080 RepID=UPI0002EB9CAF|nr:hypothetical protein [Paenibacillus sp. PAMC 26794]